LSRFGVNKEAANFITWLATIWLRVGTLRQFVGNDRQNVVILVSVMIASMYVMLFICNHLMPASHTFGSMCMMPAAAKNAMCQHLQQKHDMDQFGTHGTGEPLPQNTSAQRQTSVSAFQTTGSR